MEAANSQGQSPVAIRRFESGAYASDEAVYREYIRALALTNQLSRLPVSQLGGGAAAGGSFQQHAYHPSPSAPSGGGFSAAAAGPGAAHASGGQPAGGGGARGTVEQPLHVQYHESARNQLLRMLQRLAFFGLAAGGLMMLIDEKVCRLPRSPIASLCACV